VSMLVGSTAPPGISASRSDLLTLGVLGAWFAAW
jgi:hypothetical protein